MDKVQKEKIERLTKNFYLLLQILKDADDDKKIEYLKMQHESNDITLRELGIVENKDKDRIRNLNERVRELEKERGGEIDGKSCCNYASSLVNKIDTYFESIGIKCSPNASINEWSISITLDYLSQVKKVSKYDMERYNNESEVIEKNNEAEKLIKISQEFFEFIDSDNENKISFDNHNTEQLKKHAQELLENQGVLSGFNFKSGFRNSNGLYIQSVSFSILCSDSALSFREAFANR